MRETDRQISKAVLTGPTGVLGTALIKKFLAAETETYVICHPGSRRTQSIPNHPFLHKIDCDMSDYASLPEKIGTTVDAFFHFAWLGTSDYNNRMNMPLQAKNI